MSDTRYADPETLAELERLQAELAHANTLKTQWKEQLIVSKHIEDSLHKQLDAKEVELASLRKQIGEMQLVPKEPTEEMLRAGLFAEAFSREEIHSFDDSCTVYKAMLAAAPKPEDGK